MKKYKVRVNKISLTKELYTLIGEDGMHFISPIKKGSVDFKIYNESKQEVNLGNILEDDLITIYGVYKKKYENDKLSDNIEIKEEKNNIVIKKIRVKNIYMFTSDTSEEVDEYE